MSPQQVIEATWRQYRNASIGGEQECCGAVVVLSAIAAREEKKLSPAVLHFMAETVLRITRLNATAAKVAVKAMQRNNPWIAERILEG